jgi:hypothetical protein
LTAEKVRFHPPRPITVWHMCGALRQPEGINESQRRAARRLPKPYTLNLWDKQRRKPAISQKAQRSQVGRRIVSLGSATARDWPGLIYRRRLKRILSLRLKNLKRILSARLKNLKRI